MFVKKQWCKLLSYSKSTKFKLSINILETTIEIHKKKYYVLTLKQNNQISFIIFELHIKILKLEIRKDLPIWRFEWKRKD